MARYGYARVSSTDQDYATQEARLREAGCKVVRTEKASGKSRDGRDELARIMDFLHAGDELVVVVATAVEEHPVEARVVDRRAGPRVGAGPRTGTVDARMDVRLLRARALCDLPRRVCSCARGPRRRRGRARASRPMRLSCQA